MLNEFTVDFRTTEKELDFLVALSMTAEGTGAALFVISFLIGAEAAAWVGLGMVCVGAAALFSHLGHPLRFWRVISKTHVTWISRGAIFTGGLIVLGALSLLLPEANGLGMLSQVISLLCALVVMLYTGFLFSSMQAIPFWHSPLLPSLFLVQSVATAGVFVVGALPWTGNRLVACPQAVSAVTAVLVFTGGLTWVYLRSVPASDAARESVRLLTEDRLKPLFLVRGVAAGLVVPVVLVVLATLISADMGVLSGLLVFTAMPLRLWGDMSFRHAILRAGVSEPVI